MHLSFVPLCSRFCILQNVALISSVVLSRTADRLAKSSKMSKHSMKCSDGFWLIEVRAPFAEQFLQSAFYWDLYPCGDLLTMSNTI